MLNFSAYRLSIIKTDDLFNIATPKEEYFHNFLKSIIGDKKKVFVVSGKKYIFYYISELLDGVYCFELAKEEIQNIPFEGETKVEEQSITKTPFVYVIIDQKKQLVLIQMKTTVFPDINVSRGKIEHIFTDGLQEHQITTYLNPVGDNKDFWREVEESDSITELDICLTAPNMFKGRIKAEEFVEGIKQDYNITQVDMKFKNREGKLKLLKENVGDFINLVTSGGGEFKLFRKKNGKRDPIKSSDLTQKKNYEEESPQDINKTELGKDLTRLDTLNEMPERKKRKVAKKKGRKKK